MGAWRPLKEAGVLVEWYWLMPVNEQLPGHYTWAPDNVAAGRLIGTEFCHHNRHMQLGRKILLTNVRSWHRGLQTARRLPPVCQLVQLRPLEW